MSIDHLLVKSKAAFITEYVENADFNAEETLFSFFYTELVGAADSFMFRKWVILS